MSYGQFMSHVAVLLLKLRWPLSLSAGTAAFNNDNATTISQQIFILIYLGFELSCS